MKNRQHPDPLTVAYVAMGAGTAIGECPCGCLPDRVLDAYQGQMEFIAAVIHHALMLDRMADERGNDFSGVFAYEVAEPFGEEYAKALINAGNYETVDAEAIARRLLDTICA